MNTSNNISYHRPKFEQFTVWNPNGIVLADNETLGTLPFGIFINKNDTIYVVAPNKYLIYIWLNDSLHPTTNISMNSLYQSAIFVTINDEIYTSPRSNPYAVNKWLLNSSNNQTTVLYTQNISFGVFVDINSTLYFSIRDKHKVLSKSLQSSSNILTLVAGTSCPGNTADALRTPHGIFVDTNFDLYVADSSNNRIQRFQFGQKQATTVVGNGLLAFPTHIILDFDKNLFIVDAGNDRIVVSGSNHTFRCILGCSGTSSSNNDQFLYPVTMAFDSNGHIYVVDQYKNTIQKFVRLKNDLVQLYNQPKFCSNSTWNSSGITFANHQTIGSIPIGLFIDNNNSIYSVNRDTGQILIWMNNSLTPNLILYTNLSSPRSIFVTINGDIYVDNSSSINRVVSYTNKTISIANISASCYGLFVDISNSLYCSIEPEHKVFKKWLNDNSSTMTTVAGNGSNDSTSNLLNNPKGIFVDTNFDLYVADCYNNRIQLFRLGQLNGETINITIPLNGPTNVILDGNRFVFITDSGNNRIIGSDENGFRCIVGCSNSNQLNSPRGIAFDSFGNLYVVDRDNNRIQKFIFLSQSCNQFQETTQQNQLTVTDFHSNTILTSTSSPSIFLISNCPDKNTIGTNCNISSNPCDLLDPCKNDGICQNSTSTDLGYICNCSKDFVGLQCQHDHRLCKPTTCWNNGTCNETSDATFQCSCQSGWTGEYCERMIDYCETVTCENNAPCRSLFMNYTCECLTENYSGRYCEIVSTKLVTLQFVSKSFGYIAILFLLLVIGFVVIMDVLKYGFGIDPAKHELERIRREKARKRKQHQPVIQRFHYVN